MAPARGQTAFVSSQSIPVSHASQPILLRAPSSWPALPCCLPKAYEYHRETPTRP